MRYPILDALRFALAFWVVIGHFGMFPLFSAVDTTAGFGRTLVRGWNTIPFGTAAVIGFFVISGFCIHLPFRGKKNLAIARYYARRYTRILIPLIGTLLIWRFLLGKRLQILGDESILWHSIFWSLLCEEIYYAAYPMLRLLRNRFGWNALLGTTFLLSVCISATHRYAVDWHVYGPLGTALILLPVWLLGCLLAEQVVELKPLSSAFVIWKWRFLAWAGSWICEMLYFKARISYTYTMVWFGVLAFFWIRNEIAYGMHHAPWRVLASAGAWSYSLYLTHGPAAELFGKFWNPNVNSILGWCTLYAFILALAYLFYLLVERPSHRMARRIALVKKSVPVAVKEEALQSFPL